MIVNNHKPETGSFDPSVFPLVTPTGLTREYLSESDGPYHIEIRHCVIRGDEWAFIYKGKEMVFNCNATFANHYFAPVEKTKLTNKS